MVFQLCSTRISVFWVGERDEENSKWEIITTHVYLLLGTLTLIFSLFLPLLDTDTHTPASCLALCSEAWIIWVVMDKSLKGN